MGILLGPFDPIKLIFNIINVLMSRNLLSEEETRTLLKNAMDPQMPEDEKENILNSIIRKGNA